MLNNYWIILAYILYLHMNDRLTYGYSLLFLNNFSFIWFIIMLLFFLAFQWYLLIYSYIVPKLCAFFSMYSIFIYLSSLFHGDISENFQPALVKTGGSPGKLPGHDPWDLFQFSHGDSSQIIDIPFPMLGFIYFEALFSNFLRKNMREVNIKIPSPSEHICIIYTHLINELICCRFWGYYLLSSLNLKAWIVASSFAVEKV